MNKKVIKTSIALTIIFLVAWYILKIFFPEEFVLRINNEKLVSIGKFIDSHIVLSYACGIITSYIMYWLYLCAVCKKKKLSFKESLIVIGVYIVSVIIEIIDVSLGGIFCIIAMVVLPAMFKAELKNVALVLSFHLTAQALSLQIRGLSALLLSFDFLSLFVMTLECYFWLLLFYILLNYYEKGEKKDGC